MTQPKLGAARKGDKQACLLKNVVTPESGSWIFKKAAVNADHVGGPILTGSPTVNVNGRPASRAGDAAECTPVGDHTPILGTGSSTVFINGRNAARIGTRTTHTATVTEGSVDVLIGGDEVGATLGDSTAATNACKTASAQRMSGSSVQGGQMNCGPENIRQLCIQKCQTEKLPPTSGACQAANTKESDWYVRFLTSEKDEYNKNNAEDVKEVRTANDAAWVKVKDAKSVSTERNTGQFTPAASWEEHQGQLIYLHTSDKSSSGVAGSVRIKRLPVITDPQTDWNNGGWVGSSPEGRQRYLMSQCGIAARNGENTPAGIAGDVGDGKKVIASVDVGKLNGRDAEGFHAVTVSKMVFKDDGTLSSVTINDSGYGGGCGRVVAGDVFTKALVNRPSTVA